jgi:hypothetical protein
VKAMGCFVVGVIRLHEAKQITTTSSDNWLFAAARKKQLVLQSCIGQDALTSRK